MWPPGEGQLRNRAHKFCNRTTNVSNGATWLRKGPCLSVDPGCSLQRTARSVSLSSVALASEPDADRLARATARREQLTGASRPGRPCVPKHNVAANELKRISAMHEYYLCVCTRRLSCLVCRVESTTDHHVPCTGKRLDLGSSCLLSAEPMSKDLTLTIP